MDYNYLDGNSPQPYKNNNGPSSNTLYDKGGLSIGRLSSLSTKRTLDDLTTLRIR